MVHEQALAAGFRMGAHDRMHALRGTPVRILTDLARSPRIEAGLRPGQLVVRDPSMDDVFLALTGTPNTDPESAAGPDEDDYQAREGSTA